MGLFASESHSPVAIWVETGQPSYMAISHQHSHGHGSGHGHNHSHGLASSPVKVVAAALVANTILAVAQIFAGVIFGSIALMADSAHQVVDVAGLGIALVALRLATKGVSHKNTFGWARADVLGALASSFLLVASSFWIVWESIRRLMHPEPMDGVAILVVAVIGLIVNGASAVALARAGNSMSTKAAVVHLIGDAAGSGGVIIAAAAVLWANATWVDPVVAIAIAIWVGYSGFGLLRSSGRVLLDVVPANLHIDKVTETILSIDGIVEVHHMHLWEPAADEPSLSAHLVVDGEMAVHEAQALLSEVREALLREHQLHHATFEVECHPCDNESHIVTALG